MYIGFEVQCNRAGGLELDRDQRRNPPSREELEHNSHVLDLNEVATFEGGGHQEALGLVVYTFRKILGNERLHSDL